MVSFLRHVQFPITALREIKILQLLKHENVVNLLEICRTKGEHITNSSDYAMISTLTKITNPILYAIKT